jgi:cytochrome c oxidase subunit IV
MSAPKKKASNPAKTVLTIVVGFILVYLITKMKWSLSVAFFVGLAGVLSDFLAKQIDFVWMKLTLVLSYIVPNIVLTIVFYVFLFPIALLTRLFGKKDPMHLKNTASTLFKHNEKLFDKAYFEKHW